MSTILYYSKYCNNSKSIIEQLSKSSIKDDIHFVCIDKRKKIGNKVYIILNTKEVLLPETIRKVPSLLLLYNGYRVIEGKEIMSYFKPKINAQVGIATGNNMEPICYSLGQMGAIMSDNYSFLDQTNDEMSAKGDGGLRQMHNYCTLDDNIMIETPPEDYIPDKIKENDLEKLQRQRNLDINNR